MHSRRRDFMLGFLAMFSASSLLVNAALLFHISHPSFWRDLALSRLHPPPARTSDHVRGNPNASVTIVEYADFQCPYCRQMHTTLRRAAEEGRIRWVYRHDPMTSIHPLAFREAEAAECAGAQGKFWEYADAVFAARRQLNASQGSALTSVAQDITIDVAAFAGCLDSAAFAEVVRKAMSEADALQISGTPTLFIDNRRYEGYMSYENLSGLLHHPP